MSDPNRLNTLANGLRVLEHLVQHPMSMRELAGAVSLPGRRRTGSWPP